MSVILNEVKNLVESMGWKTEILRLMPQNDITTQSPWGEEVIFFGSIGLFLFILLHSDEVIQMSLHLND
jgi:hypothetical protein